MPTPVTGNRLLSLLPQFWNTANGSMLNSVDTGSQVSERLLRRRCRNATASVLCTSGICREHDRQCTAGNPTTARSRRQGRLAQAIIDRQFLFCAFMFLKIRERSGRRLSVYLVHHHLLIVVRGQLNLIGAHRCTIKVYCMGYIHRTVCVRALFHSLEPSRVIRKPWQHHLFGTLTCFLSSLT